ncbi:MAG: hypothetical protein ACRD10_01305, partial [Terriglobia bacterium]
IMAKPEPMSSNLSNTALDEIKAEVEIFLRSSEHPVAVEDGLELFDADRVEWRVTVEFGKLLLEAWQPGRSVVRRVEDIAYRDSQVLGLFVRKPGSGVREVLELRASRQRAGPPQNDSRHAFRNELLAFLKDQYPEWRFERVSSRSDRERSLSAWYARGLAQRGRSAWAFIGLAASEPVAAMDAALAYGLNWFDTLRRTRADVVLSGLKLFLPPAAVQLTAHRAAWLDPQAVQVQIVAWPGPSGQPQTLDIRDFGNVETRLTPRRRPDLLLDRHREFLGRVFGDLLTQVDLIPGSAGATLSIRVLGIEVAQVEGQIIPGLDWGLEGERRAYREEDLGALREFLRRAIEVRSAASHEKTDALYRMQPERWLESLLVRDVSRLDPALNSASVYPQVPAFSGGDRGVVDILGVLRDGRLAVIELKLDEDIVLPLQGLDYWMRVKWLNERKQFSPSGYFPGVELAQIPPRLYLVSPAFRFHSSSERIIRYLHPSIEIVKVGLNQQWREAIRVLFRRDVHPPERPFHSA